LRCAADAGGKIGKNSWCCDTRDQHFDLPRSLSDDSFEYCKAPLATEHAEPTDHPGSAAHGRRRNGTIARSLEIEQPVLGEQHFGEASMANSKMVGEKSWRADDQQRYTAQGPPFDRAQYPRRRSLPDEESVDIEALVDDSPTPSERACYHQCFQIAGYDGVAVAECRANFAGPEQDAQDAANAPDEFAVARLTKIDDHGAADPFASSATPPEA